MSNTHLKYVIIGITIFLLIGIIVSISFIKPSPKKELPGQNFATNNTVNTSKATTPANLANYTEDLGDGIKIEMVAIKGGEFRMGAFDQDENEKPAHPVTLDDYYIGKYEITQEQWQYILKTEPNISTVKGPKYPIETKSWEVAMEFCDKLSKKTGKKYTLPTEAQWEYAIKAGSTKKYFFGNDGSLLDKYAWYSDNSGGSIHPVGQKKPNKWGLYDMSGNVWEWCLDWYHDSYEGAPSDGSAWVVKGNYSPYRVYRGGSWNGNSNYCRSTYRNDHEPDIYNSVGLRVVMNP